MLGFVDHALDSAARFDRRAAAAAERGDPATAARWRGRADAQSRRAKAALLTAFSDLAEP